MAARLVLEIVYVLIVASVAGDDALPLDELPWYLYFMVFAWPVVFMPVQELVKWRFGLRLAQLQKRRKLEFNTKLGMHSPV